jgi:hypothetical protein
MSLLGHSNGIYPSNANSNSTPQKSETSNLSSNVTLKVDDFTLSSKAALHEQSLSQQIFDSHKVLLLLGICLQLVSALFTDFTFDWDEAGNVSKIDSIQYILLI